MVKSKEKIEPVIKNIAPQRHKISTTRNIDLYRDEHGNLENIECIDIDIPAYTFKGFSVKGSIFKNCKLSNIKAQGVDFTEATLDNCSFSNSDLRWIKLTKLQRENNAFENCNLREIDVIS